MIYNPAYKPNPLQPSPVWASLKTLDGKAAFNFLVNPEAVKWQHVSSFNTLNVLRSPQPSVNYQYSQTVLTIPSCHLWTPENCTSVKPAIALLKTLTKPQVRGGLPPLVRFEWGATLEDRLFLVSLDITETQWRSGEPTQAECSLAFTISPAIAVSTKTEAKPTPRQQAKPASTKPKTTTKKIAANGDIIGDFS